MGYVGTMSIQEGLDILIEVAEYVRNLGRKDIHFTCVGGGPSLAGLRKMAGTRAWRTPLTLPGGSRTKSCSRFFLPPTSASIPTGPAR